MIGGRLTAAWQGGAAAGRGPEEDGDKVPAETPSGTRVWG